MDIPDECSDKDCVTCRMRALAQELVDDDVPVDLALMMLMHAVGEAYGLEGVVANVIEGGTLH